MPPTPRVYERHTLVLVAPGRERQEVVVLAYPGMLSVTAAAAFLGLMGLALPLIVEPGRQL